MVDTSRDAIEGLAGVLKAWNVAASDLVRQARSATVELLARAESVEGVAARAVTTLEASYANAPPETQPAALAELAGARVALDRARAAVRQAKGADRRLQQLQRRQATVMADRVANAVASLAKKAKALDAYEAAHGPGPESPVLATAGGRAAEAGGPSRAQEGGLSHVEMFKMLTPSVARAMVHVMLGSGDPLSESLPARFSGPASLVLGLGKEIEDNWPALQFAPEIALARLAEISQWRP